MFYNFDRLETREWIECLMGNNRSEIYVPVYQKIPLVQANDIPIIKISVTALGVTNLTKIITKRVTIRLRYHASYTDYTLRTAEAMVGWWCCRGRQKNHIRNSEIYHKLSSCLDSIKWRCQLVNLSFLIEYKKPSSPHILASVYSR